MQGTVRSSFCHSSGKGVIIKWFSSFLCFAYCNIWQCLQCKKVFFWESQHESFYSDLQWGVSEKKPNLPNKQWQILLWCIICILMTYKSLIIFPNPQSTDLKPTELKNKSFSASLQVGMPAPCLPTEYPMFAFILPVCSAFPPSCKSMCCLFSLAYAARV